MILFKTLSNIFKLYYAIVNHFGILLDYQQRVRSTINLFCNLISQDDDVDSAYKKIVNSEYFIEHDLIQSEFLYAIPFLIELKKAEYVPAYYL